MPPDSVPTYFSHTAVKVATSCDAGHWSQAAAVHRLPLDVRMAMQIDYNTTVATQRSKHSPLGLNGLFALELYQVRGKMLMAGSYNVRRQSIQMSSQHSQGASAHEGRAA